MEILVAWLGISPFETEVSVLLTPTKSHQLPTQQVLSLSSFAKAPWPWTKDRKKLRKDLEPRQIDQKLKTQ